MCTSEGAEGESSDTPVEIKLPSDVLFEFGKSELTRPQSRPRRRRGPDRVGRRHDHDRGHTDAVGDDPSMQCRLSRAASCL